jgi:putative ABC transport system ATP-binding protein
VTLLEARGLARTYVRQDAPAVRAVAGVDLEVQEGEFVAIMGPSGSGNTTLLAILAGLEPADEGTVTILGHDLGRLSATECARLRQRRIGIIFQSFGLVSSLRAWENVALPLALARIGRQERTRRAIDALAEVGLDGAANARIDELSGGERQRVGIARALVIDPSIVLADEPTGSLDEDNGREIVDLLAKRVMARGTALLLVTHDPASAARARRLYRMLDGRLSGNAA